jgi:hypothetical protein
MGCTFALTLAGYRARVRAAWDVHIAEVAVFAEPTAHATMVSPGSFEPERHYYPRVLNAQLHPLVRYLLTLGNERIAERYSHLHPEADAAAVRAALSHVPSRFRWGGADLFLCATDQGHRRVVLIETNSSPSGQKSLPLYHESNEQGGYRVLMERTLVPMLRRRGLPNGGLAVIYDKNPMEATGYAAAMADVTGEPVWLAKMSDRADTPMARVDEHGVLHVRDAKGEWQPIRAAMRYVTERPWNRLPPVMKTALINPSLICLAGGRNKAVAAKAYDVHNAALRSTGLAIRSPETIWDVTQSEVPLWVERMGGRAVVKVPYANAGQGVFTITSPEELAAFRAQEFPYRRFIVQALIGNSGWSSVSSGQRLYHVGTVPDRHNNIYVADLRLMVGAGPNGFYPVAIYSRRARKPLTATLEPGVPSWGMLGTNLSVRDAEGGWGTEPERLVLMDERDFNRLGIGLDDLIEGYLQTILAVTAIDNMAARLVNTKGRFRHRWFASFNPDRVLSEEIA